MHETGLLGDVMRRAEQAAGGLPVTGLRLQVGALSGLHPEVVRQAARHYAESEWPAMPEVVVDESDDLQESGAQTVRLVSITVAEV